MLISLLLEQIINYIKRYKELLNRTYVDDNNSLRWCPAPDCEYAIECHIPSTSLTSIVPTVVCHCGHYMCFGCGLPNHQVKIRICQKIYSLFLLNLFLACYLFYC